MTELEILFFDLQIHSPCVELESYVIKYLSIICIFPTL
jgi:hypothetical protein